MKPDDLVEQTLAMAQRVKTGRLDSERDEIRKRVANFKALQERLRREREDYSNAVWASVPKSKPPGTPAT